MHDVKILILPVWFISCSCEACYVLLLQIHVSMVEPLIFDFKKSRLSLKIQ